MEKLKLTNKYLKMHKNLNLQNTLSVNKKGK